MSEQCVDAAFYWTPQQAEAIVDYLERLQESIWAIYGDEIAWEQSRRDLHAHCAMKRQQRQGQQTQSSAPTPAPISTPVAPSSSEDEQ